MIKNMNSKMITNSQLSTTKPKTKIKTKTNTNQANNWHRKRITEVEITCRVICKENGGKGTGNKKHKWQVQNRQGDINSIGNEKAKELMCMTHGHELGEGGMLVGGEIAGWRGIKGRKKWDNCYSITNKIYFKKSKIINCKLNFHLPK